MRYVLAAIAVVSAIGSTPAGAYCLSRPDDQSTNYVENGTAHMLCLQRELGLETGSAAEQARIDAELGNMRIELERQRQLMLQMQQSAFTAWPNL